MADIFGWRPTAQSSSGTAAGKVSRAQFGDGYSQSSADGINPISREWQVSFTDRESVIQAVASFLDAHVGQSFLWKPPLAAQGLYQCDGYNASDNGGGIFTLSATFQQSFQP
ncbi:phage tail protein [Stenotrophomonas sp. HITSZ_GD]|uniref:phage tail protein n=1 Tax=Stenotrophomonas sp. HITSZ_GD TaxID=3037248 RepID=UPI001029981F|nr:phage tail protein [Stenotrophomonas sp. HITSZ_GD]MDG2524652.1 phage tail protein [Stenotrophomonas sp. HITSZ_GD]